MNHCEGTELRMGRSAAKDNGRIKWLSRELSDEYRQTDRQTDPSYTNIHTRSSTHTYTQRSRYAHMLWLLDTVTSNKIKKKTMENLNRSVHYLLFLYKEMYVMKERVFWVRKMSDIAGICPLAAVLNSVSSLSPNKVIAQRYTGAKHFNVRDNSWFKDSARVFQIMWMNKLHRPTCLDKQLSNEIFKRLNE